MVDYAFESYMKKAWSEIYSSMGSRSEGDQAEPNPQIKYAAEFFEYFKQNSTSKTGHNAARNAFMMWGNLGNAEKIDEALPYIPIESPIWREIIHFLGNAYHLANRSEDYYAVLDRLADEATDKRSRSQVLLALGEKLKADSEKARPYFNEVIDLKAHPFDVQKSQSALYEIDILRIGADAPFLSLTTIDGLSIEFLKLRGKVVLLEFWSTHCGPCIPDIPLLRRLYDEIPATQFQLVGITDDRDLEGLRNFLKERSMKWPQVQEPVEWARRNKDKFLALGQARSKYNVFHIPRSFIINREGKLVAKDLRGSKLVDAALQEVHRTDH